MKVNVIRGVPAGTVSTPIAWDEVPDVEPASLTLEITEGVLVEKLGGRSGHRKLPSFSRS